MEDVKKESTGLFGRRDLVQVKRLSVTGGMEQGDTKWPRLCRQTSRWWIYFYIKTET